MIFLIGLFAQLGQILMFREVMALFHGTELLFGTVLGGWVIWTAIGAAGAELFLKRKTKQAKPLNPLNILAYSTLLNGFLLALQIIFLRFYPVIFSDTAISQAFSFYGAITGVFLALFPFAFLMGAQFTLCLWLNPRKRLGFLYRLESIGAMVGGMVTSFVLVELASPLRLAFMIGALFVTGSIFLAKTKRKIRFFQVGIALILLICAVFPVNLDRLTQRKGFSFLEVKETRYGRIEVLKNLRADQYLVFHNSALVSSIEPGSLDQYEQQLAQICLTQHPEPGRVLLIGGALRTLPENIIKHGTEELTALELDPLLFTIYETYSGHSRQEENIIPVPGDGRSFVLSQPDNYYDMVIGFSGEPDNAAVNRFCTKEFFLQVNRVLKPDGVFCLFLPTHGAAHEYLAGTLLDRTASVYKAMKSVYQQVLAVQVEGHLLLGSQSDHRVSLDPEVLAQRQASRPGARPFYQYQEEGKLRKELIPEDELPAYFSSLFGGVLEQKDFFADETLNFSHEGHEGHEEEKQSKGTKFQQQLDLSKAKINRDTHPVAVTYSMMVWEGITAADSRATGKSSLAKIFDFIEERGIEGIIIVPVIFVSVYLLSLIIIRSFCGGSKGAVFSKSAPLAAACITGCFSITTEIILLSLYQALTGYLYYSIGILLAIFMGGLALGAKLTDKEFKNPWRSLTWIFVLMILLCVFIGYSSGFLSGITSTAVVTFVFVILMLIDGILCGAAFPLLGFLTSNWKKGRPGAWVYAFDLVGAGIGAFFIAPFLIPGAGIHNTLVMLALLLLSLIILSVPLSFYGLKR